MIRKLAFTAAAALLGSACDTAADQGTADHGAAGQAQANQPHANQAQADPAGPPVHKIVAADQVSWGAGPPTLPAGAQAAVLHGDPTKEGMFVMRLKVPGGFAIAPHTHPKAEIVTVISGAFHVGMGEVADKAKAQRLPAGSFFAFDPGMAHYAHTEEETVVQISTTGPWAITYVNPADDPRGAQ